ncbi:DUF3159 domain-containing protein [Lentzea sp. BCCO 10_0061]|uniref:DUF3159 domain-containing protein n=1 Tax=Lentzea sokolovensis TaxID=3095429 RepID=A0ABU4UVX4_9PSEU|nr:DUF3159 domain-containing protein [Lentzea sp. BCCO 10_0061]MDX8143665.1 DUF3159 domain-containing protein [Lentzea sp. BCCO 10_0061]
MTDVRQESLASLLGGRGGALDASLPPLAFVAGWLLFGHSIGAGAVVAVLSGVAIGVFRLVRGEKPRAVLLSLLLVVAAALVALYTGRVEDFFLIQLLSNVASALAWAGSIAVRWPFLGLVVGTLLGQKTRWRRDPALLRAYSVASWAWVGQYVLRVAIFTPLWLDAQVFWLATLRVALSWPLQIVCIVVSGWLLKRALPADHPGFRHPQTTDLRKADQAAGETGT